jgi:hypothetical protein
MSKIAFSRIDEATEVAARLVQRSAAVEAATQKRDNTLYKFLANLHQLDKQLRKMSMKEALKTLKQKYGDELPTTRKPENLLLKLTYPDLSANTRSKYAATLRYVREKKKPTRTVKSFVRANGGINGCVAKEKKLREKMRKASGTK